MISHGRQVVEDGLTEGCRRSERTARDAMCAHIRNAGDPLVNLLAERSVLVD